MLTYLALPFLLLLTLVGIPFGAMAESDDEEESESEDEDESEEEDEDEEEDSEDSETEDDDEEDEDDWGDDFDAERAKKTILTQRKSEKQLKDDLKAEKSKTAKFEKAEAKADEAKKSEIQKATERADTAEGSNKDLTKALKSLRIRHAVAVEASILGFNDPDDAYDLGDIKSIEYDDETESVKPKTVTKMLEALAKDKPYLIEAEDDEPTGGTPKNKRHKDVRNRIRDAEKARRKELAGDVKEATGSGLKSSF